jgi:CRP-like cAMP-binding protein
MVEGPRRRIKCASCDAQQRSEWCCLAAAEVSLLDAAKVPHRYRCGETLFYEGNPCLGLFCLEQGTVALRRRDTFPGAPIIRLVEAGHTLGYREYFSGSRYSVSAHAATECSVCFVEKAVVDRLFSNSPQLRQEFLKRMAVDLAHAEQALLHATLLSVRARIAHVLLELRDRHGQVDAAGNIVIDVPLSRQDLASLVGTRPESLSRAIKALEVAGVAKFTGRRVLVPDLDVLVDEMERR